MELMPYNVEKMPNRFEEGNPTSGMIHNKSLSITIFAKENDNSIITSFLQNFIEHKYKTLVFTKDVEKFSNIKRDIECYENWDASIVGSFIQNQKQLLRLYRKNGNNELEPKPKQLLVVDKVLSNEDINNSSQLKEILLNGRCYFIALVLILQDINNVYIKPDLRCNLDIIVIASNLSDENLLEIYNYYAGWFPTYSDFIVNLNKLKEQRKALLIDNFEDKLFSINVL
jgi:hypothetical protein